MALVLLAVVVIFMGRDAKKYNQQIRDKFKTHQNPLKRTGRLR